MLTRRKDNEIPKASGKWKFVGGHIKFGEELHKNNFDKKITAPKFIKFQDLDNYQLLASTKEIAMLLNS